MPTLKHDITSALPPRRIYGRQGDQVLVISRSGHVLIVQGPDHYRFSILDADLTERLPDAVDPPEAARRAEKKPEPVPVEVKRTAEVIHKPVKTRTDQAPKTSENQGSLF
jgi:hypothetical protein